MARVLNGRIANGHWWLMSLYGYIGVRTQGGHIIAAVVVSEINDTGELFFSCGWLVCI